MQLGLRPDITNLTRRHLYEIKPVAAQTQATAEATMYLGLFTLAGVPMTLGPTTEPGTSGAIPAPGSVYLFESAVPGTIVYQYRRGRLIPVPVRQPETETETETSRSRWRFELRPLTPQQQAAMTMTVGTIGLIMLAILLIPVGA